jgi:hypothetical protein
LTSPLADDLATMVIPTDGDPPPDMVRTWVADVLVGVPAVPRLRAVVVADELVSNARRYGCLPCVLRLSLHRTRRRLLVCVEDSGDDDGVLWPSGAGLSFVEGLTSDWAVDSRPRGKAVWAEIVLGARVPGLVIPPRPPRVIWP